MLLNFRKWAISKLVGKMQVIMNCEISDYDFERNFAHKIEENYIFDGNTVFNLQNLIVEEMYTGSKGKRITRVGNTFVLSIR